MSFDTECKNVESKQLIVNELKNHALPSPPQGSNKKQRKKMLLVMLHDEYSILDWLFCFDPHSPPTSLPSADVTIDSSSDRSDKSSDIWLELEQAHKNATRLQACTCKLVSGNQVSWSMPHIRVPNVHVALTSNARDFSTPKLGVFKIDLVGRKSWRVYFDNVKMEVSGEQAYIFFRQLADCAHPDIIRNSFKRSGHAPEWSLVQDNNIFSFDYNADKGMLQLGYLVFTWPTTWTTKQIWSFHWSLSTWFITTLSICLYKLFNSRHMSHGCSHHCISFEQQKKSLSEITSHKKEELNKLNEFNESKDLKKTNRIKEGIVKLKNKSKSSKSSTKSKKSNKIKVAALNLKLNPIPERNEMNEGSDETSKSDEFNDEFNDESIERNKKENKDYDNKDVNDNKKVNISEKMDVLAISNELSNDVSNKILSESCEFCEPQSQSPHSKISESIESIEPCSKIEFIESLQTIQELPMFSTKKPILSECLNLVRNYNIHYELSRISNDAYTSSLALCGSFRFLDQIC
ncbi:MAG: hypothetical protein Sylvanvirus24_3 [Sylvanvirus sp.]|uniref:Uncharacterized protein n=1 Tax=Sylvanvirus sp. TaxID=2487774 RepID=A0A3G5AIW8_9VIRU|nr:MAG: hypothetical protein Sylvanvirus24_3 [Sylvanvirus sp.]